MFWTRVHEATYPHLVKYTETVGNGSTTNITVTHGIGTRAVKVSLRQVASPYAEAVVENEATSTTAVLLKFAQAPSTNEYEVTIIG